MTRAVTFTCEVEHLFGDVFMRLLFWTDHPYNAILCKFVNRMKIINLHDNKEIKAIFKE